jgi:hypothetical protein
MPEKLLLLRAGPSVRSRSEQNREKRPLISDWRQYRQRQLEETIPWALAKFEALLGFVPSQGDLREPWGECILGVFQEKLDTSSENY